MAPAIAAATAPAAGDDWLTYYHDAARSGSAPGSGGFTQVREAWRSAQLDGDVYAQPLVAQGRVLVATENNTVSSFDLATGQQVWSVHLGEPIPRSMLPCGNIESTGITSSPAVDLARGLVYAVAFVQPGRHELVGLDLTNGAIRFRTPIDPAGASPLTHQQRASLNLSRGTVYVAYGGLFGDCGDYHGWVLAADGATGAVRATFQVPTQREGAIWAPPGPAIDAAGQVWVATGNGSSTDSARFDYGDAVLKLSADLKLIDWFAPRDWAELNRTDADIGSVSPVLLDRGLVFQIGKSGLGYLLRADRLGQQGGELYQAKACEAGFGGGIYQAPLVYVSCTNGLSALRVTDSAFSVAWQATGFYAGPPILAAGAVWTIGRDGTVYALDPGNGQIRFKVNVGQVTHFASPSASGRYILVPGRRQLIAERLE